MKRKLTHIFLRALQFSLSVFLFLTVTPTSAQVSNYTFNQSAGTFTLITGTTVASGALGNMDDNVFGPIAIPSFVFNGSPQTSIYISTNGYITFGSAPTTTDYNCISSTAGFTGAIAAFSEDLDQSTTGGGHNVRYQTVGNEFVIQWLNVCRFSVPGENISFQIRLNFVTNQINVVYGVGQPIAPGSYTFYPQVGLRGANNTFPLNVNNRSVVAATGSWVNSVAGTSNTSSCYFNSATPGTVPATGTTYTWIPSTTSPTITSFAPTSICPGGNVVITGTNYTGATSVTINGVAVASFVVNSATQITATASLANTSGQISIVAPTGTTISAGTLTIKPGVTGLTAAASPTSVCAGGTINLTSSANPVPTAILTENFNAGAPMWTRTNTSTGGTPASAAWTNRPDGYSYAAGTPYHTNDNSQFVLTNSDAQGSAGTTRTTLQSPAFSTVGMTNITVDFYHYYEDIGDNGDSAVVEVSLNATSWTIATAFTASTGLENAFTHPTVNLPAGFNNQPTVYIRFRYIATWDWYWAVDNVTVSGSAMNFTYSWTSSPVGFTSSVQNPTGVTPPASSTYTVQYTNSYGCSATTTTNVTVNPLPTVTANSTAASVCTGNNVTLTGGGATSYTWTGGVTDGLSFTPVSTTTYTVTGTDGNGCSNTASTTVTVNPLPTISATASPATICMGSSSTLTASGGTTYNWMPGSLSGTSVSVSPSSTVTYTVTGTDGNGCANTGNVTVTVNPLPNVLANTTASAVCAGNTVTLTGSGATSYTWTGGVTDGVAFAPVSTNTYTVSGTDGNGCVGTDNVTVTVNPLPTVTANTTASSVCTGNSVTLTGGGATSYTWSGGVTDGVAFTPVSTNTYTVTGTDGNGCSNTASTTVTVNPLPTVGSTASPSTSVCTGSSVTLNGTGATTYTWSGGITNGVAFTPVSTTTYTVTGTDGNGCTNTASTTVTVNPLPTVGSTASPSTTVCAGSSVTLNGTGATTYTWSGGVTNGVAFVPGSTTTYTVTGTDGNGCSNTASTTVTVNPLPTVGSTASPSSTVCAGSSVTLNGTGATTYTWSGGVTNGVAFVPVSTTTYTVTGTNSNGCTNTATQLVTVNPLPTVGSTASPSTSVCTGSSVTLNGTGATTYTWSGGVTNGVSFVPVSTTTYTVTGTDANGCSNTASTTVTVNPLPTVGSTASPSTTVCAGSSVTLNGTGATTYTWSGGVTNGVAFVPVATTTYTVTGTNSNGCSNTATTTITVNPLPTVGSTASPSTTVCAGSSVTLNGTGATTYTWSGGVTNGVAFVPVATTTYTVTGTNSNGCSNTATTTITVNPLPTVGSTASPSTTVCTGSSVTLNGTGATTYTWSGGVTNGVAFIPVATTTYTVTGTNSNGCTNTATTTITVNPLPTVGSTASPSTSVCTGSSVTLNGTGATTYTWSGGITNGISFVPVSTTTYTVTGTDGNGCSNTASTTITVNPLPTVTANSTASAVCAGNSVTLTGGGATSYTWSGGVTNGISFVPVSTTTYTVTGTDGNGCSNTASTTVTVNPLPTVTANSTASAVCTGNSVTLTGGGATSYTWTGGVTNGVSFVPVSTTTYTVTGTDGNGCSNTASTTVTVNPLPTVTANSTASAVCTGNSVTLTGGGATSYTWTGGVIDGVAFAPVSTNTYTVTGTDGNGCTNTASTTVTVNPLPTVTANSTASAVCSGNSVTLTGGGATSYTWTGGVTDGISFVPTSTNTYTVTGTDANGCSNTASTTVTVNSLPVVALGPDVAQCSGSVVLDAQNAGSTYMWNDNSTSQTLTASSTGIYWVDVTNSNGCTSRDSVSVTINNNPSVVLGADITQCGGTVTLDAQNAGATYLWSDNSTNQMLTVTTSGTYSVLVTLTGGCTATDAINITINTVPTVALGADVTQCGGSVTLDAQNAGSTYLWSDNSTAQTLSVNTTGNYSVMVTDPSTGCMNSDTAMITINTVPVVALGADIAQCGGSVTLDAQNAGATYLWSDNSTAQTLSVNTTGNYSVTVTDPLTGCMNSDAITVTINAAPSVALGPDATQCGGSVTLNAQNAGSTYLWSDNSTNQMLIVTATGNYFVMVTDPSTGCSNGDTIMITINTLPVITFSAADTVCINDAALILSATPAGGAFSGPGVGGSSFSPPTAGLGNATVAYSFTDANGCSASSQQVINVDACTGVTELNNNGSISVFPNPNNGNFTVQITNANGEGVLEVTDALGQVISSESIAPANGSWTKEISLANYSSGVYFVRFTTNNSTSVQKVIIQR